MDTREHNRLVWDRLSSDEIVWSQIAPQHLIDSAKDGEVKITLATTKHVPKSWLENLPGKKILCLASGGGQQGPILAAAGGDVTVFDISENQLKQDQKAAAKYGLSLKTVQGTADNLSHFSNNEFDLVVNPVSNCFFETLEPVWKECERILKSGGQLMYGFNNPIAYQFDFEKANKGQYELKYRQPYSDKESLSDEDKTRFLHDSSPLEFGHSLSDQINLLLKQGFVLEDMYEEGWGEIDSREIDKYFPQFICCLCKKI